MALEVNFRDRMAEHIKKSPQFAATLRELAKVAEANLDLDLAMDFNRLLLEHIPKQPCEAPRSA